MTAGPDQWKPDSSGRTLRLLIAEDNAADAELITTALKQAGYPLSFDIVDSAEEFQQRLKRTDYDIILSDHNLRTWTGMDALEILQQSAKDIPFVVVTGTLGDEAAVEYIKRGAADYVLKHRLERLPSVMNRALSDKAHREEAARLQEQILYGKREWELTFDSVPDAMIVLGETGCVQRANRAAVKALGFKEFSDLIGKPCPEIMHGQNPKSPDCPHCLMLQTGKEERHEFENPLLGKVFEGTCTPLRDSNGAIAKQHSCRFARHHRAQAGRGSGIAASEVRYRRLFEAAQEGILILDAITGIIVDSNPFLEHLLGYTHEELLGQTLWDIGLFKDIERSKTVFKELQVEGQVRYDNLPLEAKDGTLKQVEFVSNTYYVDQKKVIQCNVRDITERAQAESLLREKAAMQEQLSNVISTVPGAVFSFQMRPDGTAFFPFASTRFQDIFNLPPEELKQGGESAFAMVHQDEQRKSKVQTAYQCGVISTVDAVARRRKPAASRSTGIWGEINSLPVRQPDGRRIVAWNRDRYHREDCSKSVYGRRKRWRRSAS